jgi:methyltransferase
VTVAIAFLVVFILMIIEARVSAAHDRVLRMNGAHEPAGDVYRVMQVAYPVSFLVMMAEGLWRGVTFDSHVVWGLIVFVAAKALKYWAIASLGVRWTFRVLVPPGSSRTQRGPYRWLGHPNYIAVAGELAGIGLATHAWYTGGPVIVFFSALMLRRINVEERALAVPPMAKKTPEK